MILAWSIYFIDFPQVRLYVCAHVTLVWCQHFRTRGVQWRQFTKCSDPSVLWRLTTPVLLVQNPCFRSRIIDETLMFNCTPGLVISSLYRRVSTSGPLYCGYSHLFNTYHVWQAAKREVFLMLSVLWASQFFFFFFFFFFFGGGGGVSRG